MLLVRGSQVIAPMIPSNTFNSVDTYPHSHTASVYKSPNPLALAVP
jgi:hypothetical protein